MPKTQKPQKPLSWTPRRRGHIYCAPACGGRCTLAQYHAAKLAGQKLCERLGRGWKPRVWENLGWHYKAISACGRWKVHGSDRCFTALLGDADSPGGKWAETARTPEAAIRKTWEVAQEAIAYYEAFKSAAPSLKRRAR